MNVPTANQVIEAILGGITPAHRANATRKLNAYVQAQVDAGKSEKGVRAAIKAHVTRRK